MSESLRVFAALDRLVERASAQNKREAEPAPSPSPVVEVTEEMVMRMAEFLRDGYGHKSQGLDFWTDDARAALIAALRVR